MTGAIVLWAVVLGLAVGTSVGAVVTRRRRVQRVEALLSNPGAMQMVTRAEAEGIRRGQGDPG